MKAVQVILGHSDVATDTDVCGIRGKTVNV